MFTESTTGQIKTQEKFSPTTMAIYREKPCFELFRVRFSASIDAFLPQIACFVREKFFFSPTKRPFLCRNSFHKNFSPHLWRAYTFRRKNTAAIISREMFGEPRKLYNTATERWRLLEV